MKLSKQALILLLCCLLVQFTAQVASYASKDGYAHAHELVLPTFG